MIFSDLDLDLDLGCDLDFRIIKEGLYGFHMNVTFFQYLNRLSFYNILAMGGMVLCRDVEMEEMARNH